MANANWTCSRAGATQATIASEVGLGAGVTEAYDILVEGLEQTFVIEPATPHDRRCRHGVAGNRAAGAPEPPLRRARARAATRSDTARADPDSGLEEFVHAASGDPPTRGPDGRLRPGPEHGIVLVLIPGGAFTMGIQDDDPGAPDYDGDAGHDSKPRCDVELAPFFIGKYELLRAQYGRLTHRDPSLDPSDPDGRRPDRARLPLTRVTWDEAHLAAWQWGLALPTEAQWERACRAGTRTCWATGTEPSTLRGFANIADRTFADEFADGRPATRTIDDGYLTMAPVGVFAANAFGLHDMHGNVAEYCEDPYGRHTVPCRAGDGLRPAAPDRVRGRVLRGGSFYRPEEAASCGNRDGTSPDVPSLWIGMRLARRLE